ncbi:MULTISPECIES: site-specific integrase [unclassified Paenibacillus]|uniref:tyrosine-type recombinase/integrase n=1 Tax=unclassified Paenibacillus TaxID=185978 RepID=UPI001AE8C6CC|nr:MULTISPECIES: site-specific integrase [unclassified Paenibacillus]MBP1156745.1 integrase [Paenibacillus sp. PvP091]MBP1172516.1 integrase [Paenibacillus sp. PvR098]MBP2438897.1 integrase [Paenibacillus sp. PvP052]
MSTLQTIYGRKYRGQWLDFLRLRHSSLHLTVAILVSKPKVSRKEMNYWTPDEAKTFLKSINKHRLRIIFVLAIHCGMRQGEILGLRLSDIDLEKRKIQIRHILTFKKQLQVGAKTNAGNRSITISPVVAEEIRRRIVMIKEEKLAAGERYEDNGFLVCSKYGTPLSKANCSAVWKRMLKKTNMRIIRFHDLRHTCASLLMSLDIHPKIVQEQLGHSSIKITLDTYSHLMPNMQAEAATALEKLLM